MSDEKCLKAIDRARTSFESLRKMLNRSQILEQTRARVDYAYQQWKDTNGEITSREGRKARSKLFGLYAAMFLDFITMHPVGTFFLLTFLKLREGFITFVGAALISGVILFMELLVSTTYEDFRQERLEEGGGNPQLSVQFFLLVGMSFVIPLFFASTFYVTHQEGLLQSLPGWGTFIAISLLVVAVHGTILYGSTGFEKAKETAALLKEKRQHKRALKDIEAEIDALKQAIVDKAGECATNFRNMRCVCPENHGMVTSIGPEMTAVLEKVLPGFVATSKFVLKEEPVNPPAETPVSQTDAPVQPPEAGQPPIKKKRGRPRKHPLPETGTQAG